jgi:hypothetical protein
MSNLLESSASDPATSDSVVSARFAAIVRDGTSDRPARNRDPETACARASKISPTSEARCAESSSRSASWFATIVPRAREAQPEGCALHGVRRRMEDLKSAE